MRCTNPAEPKHEINKHFLPNIERTAGRAPAPLGSKWKFVSSRNKDEEHEWIPKLPFADGFRWKVGHTRLSFDVKTLDSIRDLWHQADTYWIASKSPFPTTQENNVS
jgi:hypothetical protein